MTVGAPDFQGYPTWLSTPLGGAAAVSYPPGVTPVFSGAVTNFASLFALAELTAGQGQLTFSWYADAGLTELVDTYFVRLNASTSWKALVPLEAAFAAVTFDNTGAVNATGTVIVAGSNTQAEAITYPGLGLAYFQLAHAVPASSTFKHTMNQIVAGRGQFSITPGDATGMLSYKLAITDEAGTTVGTLHDAGAPTGPVNFQPTLSNQIIELHVTNADGAAAHSADWSLYCPGKG